MTTVEGERKQTEDSTPIPFIFPIEGVEWIDARVRTGGKLLEQTEVKSP
jgi:hypothetical protein